MAWSWLGYGCVIVWLGWRGTLWGVIVGLDGGHVDRSGSWKGSRVYSNTIP
jgi:hypothetical protein